MATFIFCYNCPLETVHRLEEQLSCMPHIYIDSRPDPTTDIPGDKPRVVITNYNGVVGTFLGNISVSDIVMKVFQSRLTG